MFKRGQLELGRWLSCEALIVQAGDSDLRFPAPTSESLAQEFARGTPVLDRLVQKHYWVCGHLVSFRFRETVWKIGWRGRRDGSALNTSCSSKELRFDFQETHGSSQLSGTPVPGHLTPCFGFCGYQGIHGVHRHTYRQITHVCKIKFKKKMEKQFRKTPNSGLHVHMQPLPPHTKSKRTVES